MLNTDVILSKINENNNGEEVLLASLQHLSLSEINDKYRDVLTWSQARHLYEEAQEMRKENILLEARVFTRANPQLPNAIRSGIIENSESRSYDEMFGSRSSSFVSSGSVASMFSPAGYLTELYREAKDLHLETSVFSLNKRRPDLADLVLNQANMDEEVSTLALSNEIVMKHVEEGTGKSSDTLLQYFSTARQSASLPYHRHYETLRESILSLDPLLNELSRNPAVIQKADQSALLALLANISPELRTILVEDITEDNAQALYEQNFPLPVEHFDVIKNLADYYDVTSDYINLFVGGNGLNNDYEGPLYINDRLTATVQGTDDSIKTYSISISGREFSDFKYFELIPVDGKRFNLRFCPLYGFQLSSFQIKLDNETIFREDGFSPIKNHHYSREITLTEDQIKTPAVISIWQKVVDAGARLDRCTFDIKVLEPHTYLLKLNKAIRLCKATGLTPDELESIVLAANPNGLIDDKVLNMVFYTLFYRERYGISLSEALILSGGLISRYRADNQISVFDQLFNTPPLAGTWFNADDKTSITVDDTSHAHDALLNGLGVTQEELYQLALMAGLLKNSADKFALSLKNITALYRLALVARVNHLTVNGLYLLFSASSGVSTAGIEFVRYIDRVVGWLAEAGFTAERLWYLTTANHGTTLTPEMDNLRSSLVGRVTQADLTAAKDDEARCRLVAPYIAGALNLSSPDLAVSLLLWCETDGSFTLKAFLPLLVKETLSPVAGEDEGSLAKYLHILGQYALTVQELRLSDAEVATLAMNSGKLRLLPEPLIAGTEAIDRIISLHYFHHWINGLGRESSNILAALAKGDISVAQLASAMGLGEMMLAQALNAVTGKNSKKITGGWQTVYQMLQWVNVAVALNTMPAVIKQLMAIRLSGNSAALPTWAQWSALARSLEAALSARQAQILAGYTAEHLSNVLCGWFLANVEIDGKPLQNRNDLYSYLLIDNQVSAEVKTTRIAEAIAGVQLYINRALNRIEPNVRTDVSTRQFFTDWEINSRYASWGGISRLVYYPENYVDPLMRVGQTKMMDEMLQYINQSQLSEDTVEDAFKNYLARFETVADLKVLSAYHDNVNSDTGKTWFVGRTSEGVAEYYWRNVDMSRFNNGKLAANAWSEWVKIDAAINAWNDTIRPVVFRDRLYITWVERDEIATNGSATPTVSWRYTLKLAFLRQDGNWSAPWAYDVTSDVKAVLGDKLDTELLGLCASAYLGEDTLMVFIYRIKDSYTFKDSDYIRGMSIYADGTRNTMSGSQLSRYSLLAATLDVKKDNQRIIRKANYRFAINYDVPPSVSFSAYNGAAGISVISNPNIAKIDCTSLSGGLKLTFSGLRFDLSFYQSTRLLKNTIAAMKQPGLDGQSQWGSTFIIPTRSVDMWGSDNLNKYAPFVAFNTTKDYLSYLQDTSNNPRAKRYIVLTKKYPGRGFMINEDALNDAFVNQRIPLGQVFGVCETGMDNYNDLRGTVYVIHGGSAESYNDAAYQVVVHEVDSWVTLDTAIAPENVGVRAKVGNTETHYTAKDYVGSFPAGSFDGMSYAFNSFTVDGNTLQFVNNQATVDILCYVNDPENNSLGAAVSQLTVQRVEYKTDTILQLHETDTGVQYMVYGVYRIRLNSLLAPTLVTRANTGIGAILSMETQQLPEAKLGEGTFVTLTLDKYNPSIHGTSRAFSIEFIRVFGLEDAHTIYSGMLSEIGESTVTVFLPNIDTTYGDKDSLNIRCRWQKGPSNSIRFFRDDKEDPEGWYLVANTILFSGLRSVSGLKQITGALDFNSACALYYWELFYYVPMMCFQRMLEEKQFEQARKWMNYVWNPQGYIVNGKIASWVWNCRPLEETTSWNANPLDAIDPDAVAQNDPTHYKVATFMRFIELIITRGDMAYRELTRDALNEAKMWYVYALEVMGDEPNSFGQIEWSNPSLNSAAGDTARITHQNALNHIRAGESLRQDERTANSLTGLFLPEYNPALTECWATLRLRLYNLRHNLSIDGQPLSLSIYAEPTDPKALQASQVQASQNGRALPAGSLSLYRFPVMLERARNLTGQLEQFGAALMRLAENSDADELNTLLLQQGMELMAQSVRLQERAVEETEADIEALRVAREGAQARLEKYTQLYNQDVSAGERQAMNLANSAGGLMVASQAMTIVSGALDMVPNTFGLACGGSRWGAVAQAGSNVMTQQSAVIQINADKVSRSEMYRRRREEWEIQRDNEQNSVKQIDAQLRALDIRREAASLQVEYLETQQTHTQAQLEFMQRKFTSRALQSWMRGKLSAIYYQFFDITQSFCLMAQEALRRELNDNGVTFIRGSAWNGNSAGLMAGETLQLNLAEMEKAWFERDARTLEVTRTVSLAQVYAGLSVDKFDLKAAVTSLVGTGTKPFGSNGNEVKLNANNELEASVSLKGLNIRGDYNQSLGAHRLIKQVSVTLPALVGPYQDVRAVLNYGGSVVMPRGCSAIAISHGMNDSGQFVLDFNDSRYLPFEGIPVDDSGALTLSFPAPKDAQKSLLESLNDIILHIRYTIRA